MIKAKLNSNTGIAEMHLSGAGTDLFVESCMFCAALHKRLSQEDDELGDAFAMALSDYCRDLAENPTEHIGEMKEQVSIDPRIIDVMKEFGNES